MVDFKKRLSIKKIEKKINPIELYLTLDRKSVTGPLRPVQSQILSQWFEKHKSDRDLIVKLHTGEGKTLIGLLILQSKINSKEGPCLYICPNNYLLKQVCDEAEKFGIQYCLYDEDYIPDDFYCGEKLLITTAYKVFNGKSKFGIGNSSIKVGTVVLDDSHACIDVIKDSQSIKLKRADNQDLFNRIFTLFYDDLKEQGEGSLLEIENGLFETYMMVPYWSWFEKKTEVLKLLAENSNLNSIKFAWTFLKDDIHNYSCFISGTEIEIVPYNSNVNMYRSFSSANNRILMSATTQDDIFFIKGLSFSIDAVKNPLVANKKWSGEKMIIIPSLIKEDFDRDLIVSTYSSNKYSEYGVVSLVPTLKKVSQYIKAGAIHADKNSIESLLHKLRNKNFDNLVVICNRYDGIDLPDESCRILILDSKPYFSSMSDKYEQKCRPNCDYINKKIAQKIEQGLGRGVRGEKDYCAILIIGPELVNFMRSNTTKKYFSLQTQKQIDIGLELPKMVIEDKNEEDINIHDIDALINQMLERDDAWKEFYTNEMDSISDNEKSACDYELLNLEAKIENMFQEQDYFNAATTMQSLIDNGKVAEEDYSWYLQQLARYYYPLKKSKSIEIQRKAFKNNHQLLKPTDGVSYSKVSYIYENRMKNIHDFITKYGSYEELCLAVNEYLDALSFGCESDNFENSLKKIGELLGFKSQRPDLEIRKGPDNLWCGPNSEYAIFECKSEVKIDRKEISKVEAGQMNNHCAWFESEYGDDTNVYRFMVIPTKHLSKQADFSHEIRIIRRSKLSEFRKAIKEFVKELSPYNIKDITYETLQKYINLHCLNLKDLKDKYSEAYVHM